MDERYLLAFWGRLGEQHLNDFRRFAEGRWISFSWAAAFWSFFWFFYHRMNAWGLGVLVVFQSSNWLAHRLLTPLGWEGVEADALHLVIMAMLIGVTALPIYYRWSVGRVERLVGDNRHELADHDLIALLHHEGRTNLKGVLIVFGLIMLAMVGLVGWSYWQDPELTREAFFTAVAKFWN